MLWMMLYSIINFNSNTRTCTIHKCYTRAVNKQNNAKCDACANGQWAARRLNALQAQVTVVIGMAGPGPGSKPRLEIENAKHYQKSPLALMTQRFSHSPPEQCGQAARCRRARAHLNNRHHCYFRSGKLPRSEVRF
jgi:hypothetical protein